MIKKYSFLNPINTGAVVMNIEPTAGAMPYFEHSDRMFSYKMSDTTAVYGLGEAVRGINKRGWIYCGYCSDDPFHTEDKSSLYGAHNFLIIDDKINGGDRFGVFFDYPSRITFDIGYSNENTMTVCTANPDIDVYIIEGDSLRDIARQFRTLVGKSYIPPRWAFGFMQSRWGYFNKADIERVVDSYKKCGIPIDSVCLDIDYMERFKNFTVNDERFPEFESFVAYMKSKGIRLVPIIYAAVKVEKGYDIYEEGAEKGYFCKDENGDDYVVGVWPGQSVLPDFLNDEAGRWFGDKYSLLTDAGIEGFWNDMNEPALFYSQKGLKKAFDDIDEYKGKSLGANSFFDARDVFARLANSQDDYNSFYHNVNGKKIKHNDVHNLFGFNMTKSAGEGFLRNNPHKRTLLFSRASYIGMHRYGGIWTGDNHSWWSHILLSLQQMPSLNMCGFLYSGSDIGGFNGNCTRDLLLRWLSLGVFTPLMRNHSACGTRDQECFAYDNTDDFKNIVSFRYRLLPYIYSEFMKAAINDDMYIRPLCFDYENDSTARSVEDQVMVGDCIMIAPVYRQNASGRYVYLPEDMTMVRLNGDSSVTQSKMQKGHHYIDIPKNELVFFIKSGHAVPLYESAQNSDSIDYTRHTLLGDGDMYELYTDDGCTTEYSSDNIILLTAD